MERDGLDWGESGGEKGEEETVYVGGGDQREKGNKGKERCRRERGQEA